MSETLEFEVFTIFPGVIEAFVNTGIMGKAIERELVAVRCTDLRSFTHDRHRTVDDAPFGGGAGMVIKPEPVADALEAVIAERGPMHTILLTPSGPRFDQRAAERLAGIGRIALLCGRYEGIDDRIREHFVDECLSIGDFVLNGGEVAAAVIIEAVGRLREGVLGNPESIATESFTLERSSTTEAVPDAPSVAAGSAVLGWEPGLVLEHPHYTRPAKFREYEIPAVLLSGDHQAIERWRRQVACLRTWALRPELRPRWSLPVGHPLCIAASASAQLDGPEFERIAQSVAAEFVAIGGPHPRMRDLKQLRRQLRKRHGRDPWVVGVLEADSETAEIGPRVVLDTLAYVADQGPAPVILWFPRRIDEAPAGAIDAWVALDLSRDRTSSQRLAIPSALIDISQPHAAPGPLAPLARTVVEALRVEGLLPAGPGRAPSTDREISS